MKTRILIEMLQKADPSGEAECCIGNTDIHYVDAMPAYYDGRAQIVERDGYRPTKLISKASGTKVKIIPWSFDDVASYCQERKLPLPEMDFSEDPSYAEAIKRGLTSVYDSCEMMKHKMREDDYKKWEEKLQPYLKSGKIEDIDKEFGEWISTQSGHGYNMRKWMKVKIQDLSDWKLDAWFCDKVYKK